MVVRRHVALAAAVLTSSLACGAAFAATPAQEPAVDRYPASFVDLGTGRSASKWYSDGLYNLPRRYADLGTGYSASKWYSQGTFVDPVTATVISLPSQQAAPEPPTALPQTALGRASVDVQADANATSDVKQVAGHAHVDFDADVYPDYYRFTGDAVEYDASVVPGTISYSALDSQGRAGVAVANVTKTMVDAASGWVSGLSQAGPSGWEMTGAGPTVSIEVLPGQYYNGNLFVRSRLIGHCIGGYIGDASPVENLIVGTWTQDVGANGADGRYGGMAWCESQVVSYLAAFPEASVYYRAIPYYANVFDAIPTSVFVDVASSDGGLNFSVEVYNAAKGYDIDYRTGCVTPR